MNKSRNVDQDESLMLIYERVAEEKSNKKQKHKKRQLSKRMTSRFELKKQKSEIKNNHKGNLFLKKSVFFLKFNDEATLRKYNEFHNLEYKRNEYTFIKINSLFIFALIMCNMIYTKFIQFDPVFCLFLNRI